MIAMPLGVVVLVSILIGCAVAYNVVMLANKNAISQEHVGITPASNVVPAISEPVHEQMPVEETPARTPASAPVPQVSVKAPTPAKAITHAVERRTVSPPSAVRHDKLKTRVAPAADWDAISKSRQFR
jgi:hypothetical protein